MAEKVTSIPINGVNEDWYENNAQMVKEWIRSGGNPGSLSRSSAKGVGKIQKSQEDKIPSIPPRQPSSHVYTKSSIKPPSVELTPPPESIVEDSITIPNDACLYGFTADQMSTFFKHMKVNDRIISYMHKKGIDGKKFSTLKDSELDNLGINNPIVCFFREKSKRKKAAFIL